MLQGSKYSVWQDFTCAFPIYKLSEGKKNTPKSPLPQRLERCGDNGSGGNTGQNRPGEAPHSSCSLESPLLSLSPWDFYLAWRTRWASSGGWDGKESPCNAADPGSVSGLGRSPGGGHDDPLRYSCLENSMDRGAWRATALGSQRVGHWATFFFFFERFLFKDWINARPSRKAFLIFLFFLFPRTCWEFSLTSAVMPTRIARLLVSSIRECLVHRGGVFACRSPT